MMLSPTLEHALTALIDVSRSHRMIRDVDSFEEWQEIREELLWKYIKRVLPRDLLLVEQPRLPLHTCVEVMFRTVNTALLIYTGADAATQREVLLLIKRMYTAMQRELPAPEFEQISSTLFGSWHRALAEEERMH
jgi:hypothetical protein